jgi:predicted enzyme related to lactoylglutathione lyase
MPRPVHFEIHSADPEAAAAFYTSVFGWKISKWDGPVEYWLVQTGEEGRGIDGGIVRRQGDAPATGAAVNAYVCTIGVESLDETLTSITGNGGEIAVAKHEIPGIGMQAYVKDRDGNIFGVMQPV